MENSVYHINKGINKPVEFRGLKAQYIGYLSIGLVALLLLFILLFLAGMPLAWCLVLVFGGGGALFATVYRLNKTFGQYGLMKKMASFSTPPGIRLSSRVPFLQLATPGKP